MGKPICSFPQCERDARSNGLCNGHAQQLHKGRELTPLPARPSRKASDAERFMFYVSVEQADDPCWLWTGSRNAHGYGKFFVREPARRDIYAHRWAYEHFVGPIPADLVIDHLCRNTSCCNPAHLEAVPQRVNVQRGVGMSNIEACRNGHAYTPDNVISGKGRRRCATCRQQNRATELEKRRAARLLVGPLRP